MGKAGGINDLLTDVLKYCGGFIIGLHPQVVSHCLEMCALIVERCSAGPCDKEKRLVLL